MGTLSHLDELEAEDEEEALAGIVSVIQNGLGE